MQTGTLKCLNIFFVEHKWVYESVQKGSWKILFNERHFRASFYVIWLEAPRHFRSAEHWIKLGINCSWCVKRPLIILVTEARSENSVSSALLLCSNLLKTVNSFGFDTERRKEQHVQVQTPPSFPTQKGKRKKKKIKMTGTFWSLWVRGGWRSTGTSFWHLIRICRWKREWAAAASNPGPRHICWGTTLD